MVLTFGEGVEGVEQVVGIVGNDCGACGHGIASLAQRPGDIGEPRFVVRLRRVLLRLDECVGCGVLAEVVVTDGQTQPGAESAL